VFSLQANPELHVEEAIRFSKKSTGNKAAPQTHEKSKAA
jgi:hypothetical protein